LFFGGIWAAWNVVTAETVRVALQWGLPAAVALLMAVMLKMALLPVLHMQRLRLELKRLELLLEAR
jgi:uncharacterized integral membrane protein